MYYCISKEQRSLVKDYFIYFPEGYVRNQVNQVLDVAPVWKKKMKAVFSHVSQMKDIQKHISPMLQKLPKEEWFMIKSKI